MTAPRPGTFRGLAPRKMKRSLGYERRLMLVAFVGGLPGSLAALVFFWAGPHALRLKWTATLVIVGVWLGACLVLRERTIRPLQTLSNVLAALREGDYSIRVRGIRRDDALGELQIETNSLAEMMRRQRFDAVEATTLLHTVMGEIDVAIFAFDAGQTLRLANRAGERLLAQPSAALLGKSARELDLKDCLEGEPTRTFERRFPGGLGRWGLRRSLFREEGRPHQLLVIANLSLALREEERTAWQRLIRVLGHELNNSLTPIKSIAGSLQRVLTRMDLPKERSEDREDLARGLSIIGARAEALGRFLEGYARLAKLPAPKFGPLAIDPWVREIARLEVRLPVVVQGGPPLVLAADRDQLEQLLINLIRNAVDAVLETRGEVRVRWEKRDGEFELDVEDDGPGLGNPANLFVPFFTTKEKGTGIGLVLARQIAENHGGSLTVENRANARGCLARVRLPIRAIAA